MLFSISAFSQVKIEIIGNYFVATENAKVIVNHSKDNVRFIIKSPTNPASFYTLFATDFDQTRSFLWTDFRTSTGVAFASQSILNTWLYANTGTTVSAGGGGTGTSDATAALQTAGNNLLNSIDIKTPALVNGNTPVQLSAAQIVLLTPQTNGLTDAQLRAKPLDLSIGASTSALQGSTNGFLNLIDDSLNTLNNYDFATSAKQDAQTTAFNTLFKTGQNIGNTSFAINGTLPAFTSTPTFNAGTGFQTNSLTDAQLRASPINVTANAGSNLNTSALNLEITQALIKSKTDNIDVLLSTRTKPADNQLSNMTLSTAGFQKITDGTNTVTIKSAAALSADTGFVSTTSPNSVQFQNTAPGIVANKSVNVGGVYNSTLPIATTGQGLSISLDAQGRIITSQGANNYIPSLDNTTTTQLAAGATFTGLIQDMSSYQNLILTTNSNQNYTLNLLQYDDAAGLKLSETTTIVKLANQPINTSFTINGSFARITITNNGAVATTNFYASSFLGVLPTVPTALTPSGSFKVAIMEALPSGSGSIGNINSVTSISNIGISQQNLTEFRNQTLLAVAQSVKVSTGRVYSITIINPNATPVYLKLYNSLIAGITVGTTAAQKVYAVPANGSLLIEPQLIGTNFSTAISTLVTTGFLDSSNTAPATGVYVEIQYL